MVRHGITGKIGLESGLLSARFESSFIPPAADHGPLIDFLDIQSSINGEFEADSRW